MDTNGIVIAVVVLAAIHFIYSHYIEGTKDVSDVYLAEQLVVDAVRLPDESPIYKSNKLDYSHGLRIGLDIRYDHYKLRHGNLCDVWLLFVKDPERVVTINHERWTAAELNHHVHEFQHQLVQLQVSGVAISAAHYIDLPMVFALVFAAFVSQITVEIYDKYDHVDGDVVAVMDEQEAARYNPNKVIILRKLERKRRIDFENVYTTAKDKGVAVRVVRRLNPHVVSRVDYGQIHLISAVASTLKHLPPTHELSANDHVLVVQDHTSLNESITSETTKTLAALVSGASVSLLSLAAFDPGYIEKMHASVLCISEASLLRHIPLKLNHGWWDKLLFNQTVRLLSRGKLSRLMRPALGPVRLAYVHKPITNTTNISTLDANKYRALLQARVVFEHSYANVFGPFIQTDFFDYRVLPDIPHLKGFGCICQSDEIKLVSVKNNQGTVAVRGYNIGRVVSIVDSQEQPVDFKANEGFMPLSVQGRWGGDGCLYVL